MKALFVEFMIWSLICLVFFAVLYLFEFILKRIEKNKQIKQNQKRAINRIKRIENRHRHIIREADNWYNIYSIVDKV